MRSPAVGTVTELTLNCNQWVQEARPPGSGILVVLEASMTEVYTQALLRMNCVKFAKA